VFGLCGGVWFFSGFLLECSGVLVCCWLFVSVDRLEGALARRVPFRLRPDFIGRAIACPWSDRFVLVLHVGSPQATAGRDVSSCRDNAADSTFSCGVRSPGFDFFFGPLFSVRDGQGPDAFWA